MPGRSLRMVDAALLVIRLSRLVTKGLCCYRPQTVEHLPFEIRQASTLASFKFFIKTPCNLVQKSSIFSILPKGTLKYRLEESGIIHLPSDEWMTALPPELQPLIIFVAKMQHLLCDCQRIEKEDR